jgi:hypothetical protein
MEEGWIKVYKTDKKYQADIIIELLDENGITGVVMDKKDSSYMFGNIEVYVPAENEEQALTIIKSSNL